MNFKYACGVLISFALLFSCGKKNETITRSFYYWKTNLEFTTEGKKMLTELQIRKMYVKFFDVDVYGDEILPKSTLHVLDSLPSNIEIVPVIFITNATLKANGNEYAINELAGNIVRKIKGIKNCFTNIPSFKEIQLDCDWSKETKESYFTLITAISRYYEERISLTATIRLHQVKYFETTGVPPVSRGTLMFYNMGDISEMNGESSIYNEKDASKYLVNFDKYPLPLDVALPIFSWAIVFHNGKINGIVNDLDDELIKNDALSKVKDNLYSVTKTLRYRDFVFVPGDNLKFEVAGVDEALSAASLIRSHLAKDSITVTLFDYDYKNLSKYETAKIEKVFSRFE